ncbi:MAG TPA: TetR/AcrR family transcriptional regulator [Thermoleophilaceae bacterium]|jgi:AcrR family transcriptional regulator
MTAKQRDTRQGPRTRAHGRTRGRRGDILDAALVLFNEAGYNLASVQDIAVAAEASIGSVYHHFEGKEAIAAAIYVEGLADYHRGLLRTLDRERETAEGTIKAIVRHHLGWVKRNRELARFLFTSRDPEVAGAAFDELSGMNRRLFDAVRRAMEPWVEAGDVQRLPTALLYAVVLGPSQEFSRHWVAGRVKQSMAAVEPVLADAAWKAVRA